MADNDVTRKNWNEWGWKVFVGLIVGVIVALIVWQAVVCSSCTYAGGGGCWFRNCSDSSGSGGGGGDSSGCNIDCSSGCQTEDCRCVSYACNDPSACNFESCDASCTYAEAGKDCGGGDSSGGGGGDSSGGGGGDSSGGGGGDSSGGLDLGFPSSYYKSNYACNPCSPPEDPSKETCASMEDLQEDYCVNTQSCMNLKGHTSKNDTNVTYAHMCSRSMLGSPDMIKAAELDGLGDWVYAVVGHDSVNDDGTFGPADEGAATSGACGYLTYPEASGKSCGANTDCDDGQTCSMGTCMTFTSTSDGTCSSDSDCTSAASDMPSEQCVSTFGYCCFVEDGDDSCQYLNTPCGDWDDDKQRFSNCYNPEDDTQDTYCQDTTIAVDIPCSSCSGECFKPSVGCQGQLPKFCGQCYEFDFKDDRKNVVAQLFNTSAGGVGNFDIYMAAGGYGSYNGCTGLSSFPSLDGKGTENTEFKNAATVYTKYPSDEYKSEFDNVCSIRQAWGGGLTGPSPSVLTKAQRRIFRRRRRPSSTSLGEADDAFNCTIPDDNCEDEDGCSDCCVQNESICDNIEADGTEQQSNARASCKFAFENGYHGNAHLNRVRRVQCPENLQNVTGLKLKPDTTLPVVGHEGDQDIGWVSSVNVSNLDDDCEDGCPFTTTTMEDCCHASCQFASNVNDAEEGYDAMYTCDNLGEVMLD